ncbi:hypothetical protein KBB96_10000 [Luteolibacter ambystomatis]|uniref:DUF892 family protein n=1 Tax=Luteolibacter ambystomatis TaxID=2824561 RepID=A0A975J363_9BACT|nr:hypothetical protein [Luteolibacter ambystomatis]QUE53212.1 hypothetical protein KBB96_10000 [Luteolibacter ambystomatis]
MNAALNRYLNDHLAGSAGAVDLIQTLADRAKEPEEKRFFIDLKAEVEKDRVMLKKLLETVGSGGSGMLQAAGNLTAKASRLKLAWEGLDPGKLGAFEALEILVLGIQGKRVLWRMLGEIAGEIPEWAGIDFAALEADAVRQRDAVEGKRLTAGRAALIPEEEE